MAEFLQQHAGFHFTLAFVEIALFETRGGYIAQPRVPARTTNIDRGIVALDERRIVIKPSASGPGPAGDGGRRTTITQELYLERLEKEFPGISQRLNAFIDSLAAYNVSPDFGTSSMILRWRTDDTRSWNLGTITSHGELWMDFLGKQANNAGLLEFHKQYLTNLARLVDGASVKQTPQEIAWYVSQNGKVIKIDALLADQTRRDGWVRAIAEFQSAVMKKSPDE